MPEGRPLADPPCAAAARTRGEDMLGTAAYFDVWVLVASGARSAHELRASLPPAYLERNLALLRARMDGGTGMAPRTLGLRGGAGSPTPGAPIETFVAVPALGALHALALPSLEALLELDLPAFRAGRPPDEARPVEGPLVAVCTDGRVDPCCAREGMSIYRELARTHGARVWRSTHLGGCRFAASAAVFPHGILYGRLPAGRAHTVIEEARAGRIAPDAYRGRPLLDASQNAAETLLRRALDRWEIEAFDLVASEPQVDGTLICRFADRREGTPYEVCLRPGQSEESWLTCRAEAPMAPATYELLSIR